MFSVWLGQNSLMRKMSLQKCLMRKMSLKKCLHIIFKKWTLFIRSNLLSLVHVIGICLSFTQNIIFRASKLILLNPTLSLLLKWKNNEPSENQPCQRSSTPNYLTKRESTSVFYQPRPELPTLLLPYFH